MPRRSGPKGLLPLFDPISPWFGDLWRKVIKFLNYSSVRDKWDRFKNRPSTSKFFYSGFVGKILIITHGIKELQIQEFLRMLQTFSFAKSSCCGLYLIQRNVRVITISYQWWAERLGLNFRLKLNRIIVIFHTVEREKKVFGLYKGTGLAWASGHHTQNLTLRSLSIRTWSWS